MTSIKHVLLTMLTVVTWTAGIPAYAQTSGPGGGSLGVKMDARFYLGGSVGRSRVNIDEADASPGSTFLHSTLTRATMVTKFSPGTGSADM